MDIGSNAKVCDGDVLRWDEIVFYSGIYREYPVLYPHFLGFQKTWQYCINLHDNFYDVKNIRYTENAS